MYCIEIEFLAGRYHATPWGRNVNEGVPEWPPSPYRIARALADAWYRKRPDWSVERVTPVIEMLSGYPCFWLPPFGTSHLRQYLDVNDICCDKQGCAIESVFSSKKMVFDPFVTMSPGATVVLGWPEANPTSDVLADLDDLLQQISYLGRSESLASLRVISKPPSGEPDAVPVSWQSDGSFNGNGETSDVMCALPPDQYDGAAMPPGPKGKPDSFRTWIGALCFGTADLLSGWSNPPLMVEQRYVYRARRQPTVRNRYVGAVSDVNVIRYTLGGTVLPPVTSSLSVAEQVRRKLMGIHRKIMGGDPAMVSSVFSGKNADGSPLEGHRHAYFLPADLDGDGFLDHLFVVARRPFDPSEIKALDSLRSLWQTDNRPDIDCVVSGMGTTNQLLESGTDWVSATPFVPTRFFKSRDGEFAKWLREQVLAECRNQGLPSPSEVSVVDSGDVGGRFKWFEFMRSRRGQKPRHGYGISLRFAAPVTGPICLGYACHFGLGVFRTAQGGANGPDAG